MRRIRGRHERRHREPGEVHEAVAGRDEGGQVLEAVRVEAPDERPDHLPHRRDPDDGECLNADRSGLEKEQRAQNRCREDAEQELLSAVDVSVEPEPGRDVHRRDGHREERARHRPFFARARPGGLPPPLHGRTLRMPEVERFAQ
jgi:hypothetical protein